MSGHDKIPDNLNELETIGFGRITTDDGKVYPVMPDLVPYWVEDDQVTHWQDEHGISWKLAKTKDGKWWKMSWELGDWMQYC